MTQLAAAPAWWRRDPDHAIAIAPAHATFAKASASERHIVAPTGNDAAFAALVAFTAILLVAPQAWFPAIKSFRIALLAAGVAIVSHLAGRAFASTPALPVRREMVIALALVVWAAFTIPLSIWPGGSLSALTDHLIKAVVFFWLIGTVITTTARLELFGWVLTVCSLPLAVTALDNYRTGVFVTHASSAVQRIAGYVGGSGLAGNPNDLALMLNLLMPITGALFVITRSTWRRVIAGAALHAERGGRDRHVLTRGLHHARRHRGVVAGGHGAARAAGTALLDRVSRGQCIRPAAGRVLRAARHHHQHRVRPNRISAGPLERLLPQSRLHPPASPDRRRTRAGSARAQRGARSRHLALRAQRVSAGGR